MGFLLFLPAYMHSPGGIIICGPKKGGEHKVHYVKESLAPTRLPNHQRQQHQPRSAASLIKEPTLTPYWGPTPHSQLNKMAQGTSGTKSANGSHSHPISLNRKMLKGQVRSHSLDHDISLLTSSHGPPACPEDLSHYTHTENSS